MDRYTFDGVVRDLERGYQIAIIGKGREVSDAFEMLAGHFEADESVRLNRANGLECVRHVGAGGQVTFHRTEAARRGRAADVVVAHVPITDEVRMAAAVMLGTSTRPDKAFVATY